MSSKHDPKGLLPFSVKDQEAWDTAVAAQGEEGLFIGRYAARWANMMETMLAYGAKLEDIATEISRKADLERMSGATYGVAVRILVQHWEHGEALRRWHNLSLQFENEGEEANKTGGILNPAGISIG